MDWDKLRALLEGVSAGRVPVDAAVRQLRDLPYADVGFAKVDTHRPLRSGAPEAVFCQGKTSDQVVTIVARSRCVSATRRTSTFSFGRKPEPAKPMSCLGLTV